jgi:hypothetical protein
MPRITCREEIWPDRDKPRSNDGEAWTLER